MNYLSLALMAGWLFFNTAMAQTQATTDPVLIGFEKVNTKQLDQLEASLHAMPGVQYDGFCEKLQVIILQVDRTVIRDDQEILRKLPQEFMSWSPVIKTPVPLAKLKEACE